MTKQQNQDNRSNQLNPNHAEYKDNNQSNADNRSNQLNPNNSQYRGGDSQKDSDGSKEK